MCFAAEIRVIDLGNGEETMRYMRLKKATGVLAVLGLILGVQPCIAQQNVIHWKGQGMYADLPPQKDFPGWFAGSGGAGKFFADWIKRRSNGRLIIDMVPPGSVVKARESLNAIRTGSIDFIGHTYAGFYSGQMPEANVQIGLPFAWETADEMWDGLYRWGLDKELKKIYAEHNAYPITWPMGNIYGFGTSFDISTPEMMKGKRIRALGIYGAMVQKLGGSPAVLPMPELYQALMLGTIDGGIHGAGSLQESKLSEPEKFFVTYPNLNTIGNTFLINLKKFEALPEDIKTIIREDAPYIMKGWASDYSNYARRVLTPLAEKGVIKEVRWSEADAARIRQMGIGLWDVVAKKSPRTAKLVEIVKAQARALGKIP